MTAPTTNRNSGGALRASGRIAACLLPLLALGAAAEAQSLRGSSASLNRQVQQADRHNFSYLDNANDVARFVNAGL
jgi:hypothetical protein